MPTIKLLLRPQVLLPVFLILLLTLVSSLYHRSMHIDDAWLAEYAWWFSQTGHTKSEMFRGFEHYETQIWVYHKFFIIEGAALIRFFGIDLYILKSMSIFYMMVSISIVYLYLKQIKISGSIKESYLLFLVLLFANCCFFQYVFVFRPEANLMAFGLISFYLLDRGISKNNGFCIAASAAFAGLAVLTHLNSVMFVAAGCSVLFFEKKYKLLLLFGCISVIISVCYFSDMNSFADLEQMKSQFRNDPALEQEDFVWYTYLLNILKEHERFFHSPKEILFSIPLFLVVGFNLNYLRQNHRRLLIYSGILVLTLAVFAHGKTAKYVLIYLPFLCLLMAFGLQNLDHKRWKINLIGFTLIAFLLGSTVINLPQIQWTRPTEASENEAVAQNIPMGSTVLAPLSFVFNQIGNYTIQGLHSYHFFEERKMHFTGDFNVFALAAQFDNAYIIMDQEHIDRYQLVEGKNYPPYYPVVQGNLWLYKRQDL